jgi:hypothetical protein
VGQLLDSFLAFFGISDIPYEMWSCLLEWHQAVICDAGTRALARQKYWQIRTNSTTLLLYNYNLKLDCEDYSRNLLLSFTCLAFLEFLEVF